MTRSLLPSLLCASAIVAFAAEAAATTFVPQDDLAIVALDARTAERRWAHFPAQLSQGTSALYPDLLVVNGWARSRATSEETEFVLALDPATGAPREASPPASPPLARSSEYHDRELRLANGWRSTFDPGYEQKIVFVDEQGAVVWTITPPVPEMYPSRVATWNNTVVFTSEYTETGKVYAYEAGASEPSFTVDPNTALYTTGKRIGLRVVGDDLLVGLHQHVFQLDPANGAVRRLWNLSTLTGVPFQGEVDEPAFFKGGIEIGHFAGDDQTIVVGFEGRVVALDRLSGELLWHEDPGTFPSDPYPLVHEGTVLLTAGEPLAGPRPAAPTPPTPPQVNPGSGCALARGEEGAGGGAAALGIALLLARLRRRTD